MTASPPLAIDLNCDLGEGGSSDAEIMPLITSANIACGAHAGDQGTMRATVALALAHGIAIGAHPGYADRGHFGRREQGLTPDQVRALVRDQIEALRVFAPIRHVKPHGALYHSAERDAATAQAIADAVHAFDPSLILFGLAGGALLRAGLARGLRVAGEAFADRTYRADGALTARGDPRALIADPSAAVAQTLGIIRAGTVRSIDGDDVRLKADTICLHGDGEHAVALARALRRELATAGIAVRSL
jgi:UPF0271 protein